MWVNIHATFTVAEADFWDSKQQVREAPTNQAGARTAQTQPTEVYITSCYPLASRTKTVLSTIFLIFASIFFFWCFHLAASTTTIVSEPNAVPFLDYCSVLSILTWSRIHDVTRCYHACSWRFPSYTFIRACLPPSQASKSFRSSMTFMTSRISRSQSPNTLDPSGSFVVLSTFVHSLSRCVFCLKYSRKHCQKSWVKFNNRPMLHSLIFHWLVAQLYYKLCLKSSSKRTSRKGSTRSKFRRKRERARERERSLCGGQSVTTNNVGSVKGETKRAERKRARRERERGGRGREHGERREEEYADSA